MASFLKAKNNLHIRFLRSIIIYQNTISDFKNEIRGKGNGDISSLVLNFSLILRLWRQNFLVNNLYRKISDKLKSNLCYYFYWSVPCPIESTLLLAEMSLLMANINK